MKLLVDYLKESFEKFADKPAYIDQGGARVTTYRQLDELSGKIAAGIIEKGCKKGDIVPVLMPRCTEYIAAEIGILKTGCLFAPLIMDYPADRVEYILNDCGIEFYVDFEFVKNCLNNEPFTGSVPLTETDGAYVIYTSGSTGRPKGIYHNQKSLVEFVLRQREIEDYRREDTRLSVVSHSFSVSIPDNYTPLCVGSTIHMLTDEQRKDIRYVEDYIAHHNITVSYVSPSQLKVFRNKSKSLRLVTAAGERLVGQYSDDYQILNFYGTSETGTAISFMVDKKYDNTPIGRPCGNIKAYILDNDLKPVPDGEEGELCLAGPISNGYINLSEQTEKSFVKNPYSESDDDKMMFRTNDIVKRLPDGNILYVNRKDWMVKINGQRVETGEIEVRMADVDGVNAAVVKAFENEYGQNYLTAYYTGADVGGDTIREHLKKSLPDYMIPLFFVKLDAFPLNPSGKLDRQALLPPDASMYKNEYAPPENDIQKSLCSAYDEILHCGKVGIDDDFFALGGDSIKAMMLQNVCGIPGISSEIIYECKTPRNISLALQGAGADLIAESVNAAKVMKEYPLTPSQMGIYLACMHNPKGTMYNTPTCYTFDKSGIDINALKEAVETAVKNHEGLGFYIDASGGEPVMRPRDVKVDIPVITVSDSQLEKAKKQFVKPFDLANDYLFRFEIIETETKLCFLMDFHHIAFDGTSVSVICREISALYSGGEIEPEGIGQFGLSVYEEKFAQTDAYQEAHKYYENIFAGLETNSKLVADMNEDDAVEDKPCRRFKRVLPEDISAEKVDGFIKENGITENTLFLGATAYAAAKFTGQEEAVICTANHGRHDSRMRNTVGMMVRTLPVYINIDEKAKVDDYLTNVQTAQRDAIKYGNYPFVKLAGEYGLDTDIMFAYQSDLFNTFALGENKVEMERISVYSALAPLSIMIFKSGGGFEMDFEYRSDLYEYETIRSFADTVILIISEMLKKSELSKIRLADEHSVNKVRALNDAVRTDVDLSVGFVDMFRAQAEKTPDKTALVFRENRYTYRELNEMTDKIAGYIRSKGFGKGHVIASMVERSEYMTISSIGILKSGAAYQPLDPTYPPERLQFMIKDASAKMLIADEKLLSLVPDFEGEILKTDDISALPDDGALLSSPGPDDLFVLLYTSGSTGTPKGCMLMHHNITNFVHWYKRLNNITDKSAVAAYASYGFDAHMMDIYPYLSAGATEHIIPEERRLDLMWINEYCAENNITNLFMTTQVGRAFMTSIDHIAPKYIGTGGEKLVPFEPRTDIKQFNLYGPTECTILTTAFLMDKYYDPIPVGKGCDNARLYVVDKQLRMLPFGAVGELCVAGPLVSRGYLNRPEQTEKVYVENPFDSGKYQDVLYHTGDIVKFQNDGNLSYVGRRDGMVKIRGYRIELTEVESVIRDFAGIKDATVVAKDKASGGKYIAAYIVSDSEIDIAALGEFIAERKPPYMVPEAIMQIEEIPLTVNGKVDKRSLPEIDFASAEPMQKTERSLTVLETKILNIIKGIIGTDEIDISADIMHCGMTSLSIIKLAVELNKSFGYDADIKTLMKGCTVMSIEDDIVNYLLTAKDTPVIVQTEREKAEFAPLSYTQYGVYSECMKRPEDTFYNIPFMYRFPVDFGAQNLADAINTVLAAHPYIFTRLTIMDDDIVQQRTDAEGYAVPVKNMSENELKAYRADFVKPFKLMDSRLFRIEVIQTEGAVYLFAEFHHIIFDGASFDLFLNSVKTVLEGGEIQSETYDYFDYVKDDSTFRDSDEFKASEKYISHMLEKCEGAAEITPDKGGLAENSSPATVSIPLDMKHISEFCSGAGVTPAHLFLASTLYVVSRFTNSRGAYINTISNGRSDMKLTNCFGMFVKTLPIGLEIEDITALELVERAKDLLINAVANEAYPYAEVCRKFNYAPHILYAYQLGVADEFYIDGKLIEQELIGERHVKFDTGVYIEKTDGKECVNVLYNDAVYSRELMSVFANAIKTVAENITKNSHGKARKLSMLNEAGEKQIADFSYTGFAEPEIKILHEKFEYQAKIHPHRVAISACDGKFTYAEMDRRANVIANELIKHGVKNGSRVVILLERTSKFFTAMFGILKAGGAFIPTCPEYPKERIDSIIEDSGAELVITFGKLLDVYKNTVDIEELERGDNDKKPDIAISPEDLAYLIYTSGSTGKPKGVMLRHIGIASYVTDNEHNIQVRYVVENCKCYGSVTTVSFDMSLKETVVTFCNGLTLAFASDEQTTDPLSLAAFFKENNVDVFNATPSRLLVYMELDEFAEAMKNCKVILSGGEKYPDKLLSVLREKTSARIMNTYGPTEITVSSNVKELTNADEISVGRPLLNYREYIVDMDDNKLPAGVVGELLIGGLGVALGYNNLPEQTKKAFIEYEGQHFYRSGDYARWTKDGDVVILGRKDNQVKLRGLRIELGEIEKCLTSVEGIRSAIVVIKKVGHEDGICAYYTAEGRPDVEYLKSEMKKSLTDYMIPASFNQLDELPMTPNGKVNIKALSEPIISDKSGADGFVRPVTVAEKDFCQIFANILNLDEVSATDSFFELGGTSLTVTRVVIAAGKLNYGITYGDVFANPTPRSLANLTEGQSSADEGIMRFDDYNYENINRLLEKNTLDAFINGKKQAIGDVILTGATGFLGVHILHELLTNYDGNVCCLMRGRKNMSAETRLRQLFFYYFEESIAGNYAQRVTVIDGDITNKSDFEKLKGIKAHTFINCAANVKHFSKGTDIEDVNYHGVQNIITFCEETGTRLIHVSTMSVGGMFLDRPGDVASLRENMLYYGQVQSSKYTGAKFMAEREVLESAAKGLNAKIMRVGNLSARESDGEYQINFTTNSFMGRLKSTYLIGCYPYETMDMPFELSPIDYVAKAILLLAQSPRECVVFHPYNNHALLMNDLYGEMNRQGLTVKPAENKEYEAELKRAESDSEKAQVLSSMIAYENMSHGRKSYGVGKNNEMTMQALYRMGFRWPVTSFEYMKKFLINLKGLEYFEW